MRFEVSQVMDRIEQRLTTDVTLAQAVVDLGEIARCVELDSVRPVNLLRIGMAVDALSRYLVDDGAMLYPIAGRELLSEAAMTSKERMVLGRWADDGLLEVTPAVGDRAAEVADFTGLPLIAVRPYTEFAERFGWLQDSPERILRLHPRRGGAALEPADGTEVDPEVAKAVAVGKAAVPADDAAAGSTSGERPAAPDFAEVFAIRGVQRLSRTRVVRRRFIRCTPSSLGASLLARQWHCDEFDCPAFGERRRLGQPVPRMKGGVPSCPRHGEALRDLGTRPIGYAVALVVDDLPRHRFVVIEGRPVPVGKADPVDDPDQPAVSVRPWLHEAAATWIADAHAVLEVRDGNLLVADSSDNGTIVWRRSGPDDAGTTAVLHRESYELGDWDTVELYTGIELARGDHSLTTTVGRVEPRSVLVDAPTAAQHQLSSSV
ncbi:MAG TPA: hypothetical protein VFE14_15280 [Micromonosporaceae bacterium]|nr:hypothetical protein [Micromonosporaceae bacterium]